ncbi:MAG: hypothetical protein B7C24_03565 [Bacteroidetes bacterium 4572_77]|nr:MAG: hypothetical protein B7C24_03565 [Bacteroidetes bacterium 4572_77]
MQETKDSTEVTQKKKVVTATVQKKDLSKNGFSDNWFFGVKGGATFFLSPLKDNPFSWGASVSLGKQFNTKVALRLDYLYGNLKSEGEFVKQMSDGSYYKNTLSSNVDFMEIALIMKVSLNDLFYSRSPKRLREIYAFGGAAYTMFRTQITDKDGAFVMGVGYDLEGKQISMENGIAVPIGLGVTYKLDKKDIFNLNAEFAYRYVQSGDMDAGLSESTSNYTYSSLGLLVNLGQPTRTPQTITSDLVREDVSKTIGEKVEKDINHKMEIEVKPLKEDLAKQTLSVVENQNQLAILQEEMEARTNAIKEQLEKNKEANSGGVSGLNIASIYFAFNSTYITPAMQRDIATMAQVLKENKDLKLKIVGNSSNIGSPEYNKQLSLKRAEGVYALLTDEFGISADRLSMENKGLDDPLAKNIKKINRRVDLILE